MSARWALPAAIAALALGPGAAGASADAAGLAQALRGLEGQLAGKTSLSASQRSAVHTAKAALIRANYTGKVAGVSQAGVLLELDCVATDIQRARNSHANRAARTWIAKARRCHIELGRELSAAGATPQLLAKLNTLDIRIKAIAARAKAKRSFGSKATALRSATASFVSANLDATTVGGVPFRAVFRDLECVDVKVEAHRVSGALACARQLRKLVEGIAVEPTPGPPKAPVTFGSDLSGTPVAIPGVFQDDTEFWTKGVAVPVAGLITTFRVKIGSDPEDLPIRFSVVRPQPDGSVKVITTTNPTYTLPGGKPGVYEFSTSALSFKCCTVIPGDIVTINNRGTTTPNAYVWFAARSGFTTFRHTSGGDSMSPGNIWTGTPYDGYETLVQVVEQPA